MTKVCVWALVSLVAVAAAVVVHTELYPHWLPPAITGPTEDQSTWNRDQQCPRRMRHTSN